VYGPADEAPELIEEEDDEAFRPPQDIAVIPILKMGYAAAAFAARISHSRREVLLFSFIWKSSKKDRNAVVTYASRERNVSLASNSSHVKKRRRIGSAAAGGLWATMLEACCLFDI
jgi:hypothetical protein